MKIVNKPIKLPSISYTINDRDSLLNRKNIYFLNSLKCFQIKKEICKNNLNPLKLDKNSINKSQLISILNISKNNDISSKRIPNNQKKLKIIPKLSFKNIYQTILKSKLKKSSSFNNINKENIIFESNFKKIKNESNIYTSKANYIYNTKMLILNKYTYDNNKYKPDRLGLYDKFGFNDFKLKNKKRINGYIYLNHNKFRNFSGIDVNNKI